MKTEKGNFVQDESGSIKFIPDENGIYTVTVLEKDKDENSFTVSSVEPHKEKLERIHTDDYRICHADIDIRAEGGSISIFFGRVPLTEYFRDEIIRITRNMFNRGLSALDDTIIFEK